MAHLIPRNMKAEAILSAAEMGKFAAARYCNTDIAMEVGRLFAGMDKEAGIFSWLGKKMHSVKPWGSGKNVFSTQPMTRSFAAKHPDLVSGVVKAPPVSKVPGTLGRLGKSWVTALKVAPWLGMAGVGYGLYKGVPWAAKQLDISSSQGMAPGMGWSPVPYGYGSTPYGGGTPNLGMNA